ncbi:MAG TPA: hypothetical protein VMD49_11765 [Steroidobacteraceae bacterium]|nr:hypothetical protein [Steroidobacteraceae bacterium]
MNTTYMETRSTEVAAYGGLMDAIGGIATAVLAIIALTGFAPGALAAVATIVFGAALITQAGALFSEYSSLILPRRAAASMGAETLGGDSLSAMLVVGASGVVLGILALLGIASTVLVAAAIIAFGSALILSASSTRQLFQLQSALREAALTQSGGELIAGRMVAGSGGVQLLAGLAATVLGILAVSGVYSEALILVALLVLGITVMMTGGALSGMVMGFMQRPPA